MLKRINSTFLAVEEAATDFELDELYQVNSFTARTLGFKCSPMLGRYGAWPVSITSKV
eukprot:gnl/Chilomastix_caulleri/6551.p2 GENE.gnl/Chilomastix_caulleri/6551~~gnl/Chilomastix_caulleri/6551.p2  ORF type:complete len:58 (+),score=15.17 gnl/Chilomastix_caulleri/6551:174-347(+)